MQLLDIECEVIPVPDDQWLSRLRAGHFVWLAKEEAYAQIVWAWEPPSPGKFAGKIGLHTLWYDDDAWGPKQLQRWFINADGTGMDGKPLMLPLEGNCPDESPPLSEPWVRQTERTIAQLIYRLEQLERTVRELRMLR